MVDDSKQIIVFCLIVFTLTYLVKAWLWLSGGLKVGFAIAALTGVMFIPVLSAAITIKFVEHGNLRSYGIAKGKVSYYLYSLIYPFAVIALGLIFVAVLGTAPIDFTLTIFKEIYPQAPAFEEIPMYFFIINLILAPFINFIPAFGEEYGWRGFLLPKLIGRFNLLRGFLFSGVIWGLWHAPLILMGYNYPHHPNLMGVVAFVVWATLVGFSLGWLRVKSNSVFPAALGHGAVNAYTAFGAFIAPASDEVMTIPFGVPAIFALLIIALLVYYDLRKSRKKLLSYVRA